LQKDPSAGGGGSKGADGGLANVGDAQETGKNVGENENINHCEPKLIGPAQPQGSGGRDSGRREKKKESDSEEKDCNQQRSIGATISRRRGRLGRYRDQ